jgi:uncharacterized protein YciI
MPESPVHHLLLYEYVDDMADRRGPYRAAHLERIRAEQQAGRVTLAGALGDPPHAGAIVFKDVAREHIEAFVADDPYMSAGLITGYRVERWNIV